MHRSPLLTVTVHCPHFQRTVSALKATYRAALRGGDERVRFVYLKVPPEVLAVRLVARQGHFMPPSLLASQLATLEAPDDALTVDGMLAVDAIVAEIRRGLGR